MTGIEIIIVLEVLCLFCLLEIGRRREQYCSGPRLDDLRVSNVGHGEKPTSPKPGVE